MDGCGEQTIDGQPAMKPYWEITPDEAQKCMDATLWRPADLGYFRGGGYSSDFLTKGGMPVTMSRINLVKGIGPVLQIAKGYSVELPDLVHNKLDDRTNPTWPTFLSLNRAYTSLLGNGERLGNKLNNFP